MASPTEEHPHAPDLSDETQDFRFLTSLSLSQPNLPRRGEKDFEPHGTLAQSSTLAVSRDAMHGAISHFRVQNPKSALAGVFDEASGMTSVELPRGPHVRTMGREVGGRWMLLPEEALYLVERGNLDLRWRVGEREEEGLPMSLQAAYTFLVGALGLTVERFNVYAGLKRSGYVVLRGPAWYDGDEKAVYPAPKVLVEDKRGWARWWSMLFGGKPQKLSPFGPLVGNGLYRSYNDVYRLLSIIPLHDPTLSTAGEASQTREPSSLAESKGVRPLRPCFYIWKPNSVFKKSAPGPPDFRVAVLNAREDSFPSLEQLEGLLQSVPYNCPPASMGQPGQRLKHGYRNVILAVVDQGVVSYLRFADAGFGKEKIYERSGRGGSKRGGGGGRGRGRGRGHGR